MTNYKQKKEVVCYSKFKTLSAKFHEGLLQTTLSAKFHDSLSQLPDPNSMEVCTRVCYNFSSSSPGGMTISFIHFKHQMAQ